MCSVQNIGVPSSLQIKQCFLNCTGFIDRGHVIGYTCTEGFIENHLRWLKTSTVDPRKVAVHSLVCVIFCRTELIIICGNSCKCM